MKKVMIKIDAHQGIGNDRDGIEFMTEGTLRVADGEFILCYNEGELLGEKDIRTRLTVSGDRIVTIERCGDMRTKLVIERGKKNDCLYSAPQGNLFLGIFGKSITNSLTENGGKLNMSYSIDANSKLLSENKLEITVKEVN